MIKQIAAIFLVLLTIFGCSKKTAPSTGNDSSYSEDLSILRPYVPETQENPAVSESDPVVERPTTAIITQHDITSEMDSVVSLIAARNLQKRFIDGFTIQVYSGSNRDAANQAHTDVQLTGLDVPSQIVYVQPNYRVKVGKFYSRLEANKVYADIKQFFPDALLLPEKIPIE